MPTTHLLSIPEDPEWIYDIWYETQCFPFMTVAEYVFPLKPQIMKPYSRRNLDDETSIEGWEKIYLIPIQVDFDSS